MLILFVLRRACSETREKKLTMFLFLSFIFSHTFDFGKLHLRTEKYIFYLYFPTFFKSAGEWIAILLFQVIIIVDAQLLIRSMRALNNDELSTNRGLITAKEVNQIRNNVACVVARLVFVFCCVLTTGRCNAFQHIFVN